MFCSNTALGNQQLQLSEKFCNESDECNKELAETLRPYLKWFLIVLNILNLALIVISRWKPWVTKYYFHLSMLNQMALEALPINYGSVQIAYESLAVTLMFMSYSFSFWREIAHVTLLMYYIAGCREFLYNDQIGLITDIFAYTMWNLALLFNLAIMYFIISWIGYMYVEAELPRQSNERLLNNLKEGVFIVGEDQRKIMFTNTAAKKKHSTALF